GTPTEPNSAPTVPENRTETSATATLAGDTSHSTAMMSQRNNAAVPRDHATIRVAPPRLLLHARGRAGWASLQRRDTPVEGARRADGAHRAVVAPVRSL